MSRFLHSALRSKLAINGGTAVSPFAHEEFAKTRSEKAYLLTETRHGETSHDEAS